MKKTIKGFTIVELLIVIVIIGILAVITVVSFNGIQQRTQNTKRIAAAKDWQKLIISYVTANNAYPLVSTHNCLGTGYETNWDASTDEDCAWSGNIKHPLGSLNAALMTVGTLPSYPKDRQIMNSTLWAGGISYRSVETLDPTGDNKPFYPTLLYWLTGTNQDCVLRPLVTEISGGITISPTATYTKNEGLLTLCRVALPDPNNL